MIDRMIIIHITPSLQYYINTPPEHIRTHGLVGDLVSSGFRANFGIHWVFNIKRIGFIMLWPLHICANILPMLHWYYVVLLDSLEFRNITLENRQVYKSVVPDQKKLKARSKKVPIGAQRKLMYVIYITLCHHYVMYFSWCSKLEWCYSCYNFTDPPRCRAVPGKLHATDQPLNSSILVILCSFLVWSNWSNLVLCLLI